MITCGIYQIKNTITGDIYIGSSNNVEKRINEHKRKLFINKHHSIILQNSYNKYGLYNFTFSLICKCDLFLKLYMEQLYIDSMKPFFNTAKSSSAPMQGRKHSEKSKALFRKRVQKTGKDHHSYGSRWTPEMKEHFIKIRTGEKRNKDFKDMVSRNNLKNNSIKYLEDYQKSLRKPIIDNFGNIYESLSDAAIKLGVKVSTICDVLKGRSKAVKRKYTLSYLDIK